MMEALKRDFFTQSCALKAPVKAQDTSGQESVTYPTAKYPSVPCRVGNITGGERRTTAVKYLDATHSIVLSGQFHDLNTQWQASVNGVDYDILLVTPDAEGILTNLLARVVQ